MAGLENAELFVEWKTGVPMALADTNRSTFVPSGSSASPGLVPAPPLTPGAVLFLREDGTWATPSVTALTSIPEATLVGRAVGAGDGPPQALTASEATAILNIFVSASAGKKGLVPAPTTSDVGKVLTAEGWASAAPSGLVRLAGASVSSSAVDIIINFSSYTNYSEFYVQLYALRPTTDLDNIRCQFSSNGTTYTSTSYDYAYNQTVPTPTNTARGSTAVSGILLALSVNHSVQRGYNGRVTINEPLSTTMTPQIMYQGVYYNSGIFIANNGAGFYNSSMAASSMVIYCSSSSFLSGQWALYGYSRT